MTATHVNLAHVNAERKRQAQARLDRLTDYAIHEGFTPDVAATAAGYSCRDTAMTAARKADRPELIAALRLPSPSERRAARIEDIEFLIGVGEHPERAARRCGFQDADSARRVLRKWRRPDLAAQLNTTTTEIEDEDAA